MTQIDTTNTDILVLVNPGVPVRNSGLNPRVTFYIFFYFTFLFMYSYIHIFIHIQKKSLKKKRGRDKGENN